MEFYGCPECGHKIDDLTAGTPDRNCPQCGKPMILVSLRPKKKMNKQLVFLFLVLGLLLAALGVWFVLTYVIEKPVNNNPTKPVTTNPDDMRRIGRKGAS